MSECILCRVEFEIEDQDGVELIIEDNSIAVELEAEAQVIIIEPYPPYTGGYEFTPTDEVQVIATGNKLLDENIVINPIPDNYGHISYNGVVITVW